MRLIPHNLNCITNRVWNLKWRYRCILSMLFIGFERFLVLSTTQQSPLLKVPLSLVDIRIHRKKLLPLLLLITTLVGQNSTIFNQFGTDTVQSSMVIKSMWSEAMEHSKFNRFQIAKYYSRYIRYTEIWTNKNGTNNIQLAEPQLTNYLKYPALQLVNVDFCVKV